MRQSSTVAAVFAGSQPSLLADAFALDGRAFSRQALAMPLGRLDDIDVARTVAQRLRDTGKDVGTALQPLVRLAAGHPQRAMLLAHELWQATGGTPAGPPELATAFERVRTAVGDEMTAVWEGREQPAAGARVAAAGEPDRDGAEQIRTPLLAAGGPAARRLAGARG